MDTTDQFSFGSCSFCGDEIEGEAVMEYNWYGDTKDTYVFCDDTCKSAFAKRQASLKREGQNMYTPYSARANIVHSFVIRGDGDYVTVREMLDDIDVVAWPPRHGIGSIDADLFKVLYDYYNSEVKDKRGPDGYIKVVDVRLSFPPREFEEITQLLKEYKQ